MILIFGSKECDHVINVYLRLKYLLYLRLRWGHRLIIKLISLAYFDLAEICATTLRLPVL